MGIDLRSRRKEEVAKWFLASILYSKPIRESSATNTYEVSAAEGVLSPARIVETGWEGLVSLLDEGGYTRYDFGLDVVEQNHAQGLRSSRMCLALEAL